MSRAETAVELMRQGNNCGMSILTAFGPEFGLDRELALKLGRPLGSGMGVLGHVCGAVSAGFLVLGLAADPDRAEKEQRPETYRLVRDLARQFEERNRTIICRDLLDLDLGKEEDLALFRARDMMTTHCLKFVRDTAEMLEELI